MPNTTIEIHKESLNAKVQRVHEILSSTKDETTTLQADILASLDDDIAFGNKINRSEIKAYKDFLSKEERKELKQLKRGINKDLRSIKELDPDFSLDMSTGEATVTVHSPKRIADARRLAHKLEREKNNLIKKQKTLASATGDATAIALLTDEIERRAQTIAQLQTGDRSNLAGYQRDPNLKRFVQATYVPGQRENIGGLGRTTALSCPPVGGLLAEVDTMDDGQKRRVGNVAQLAGYALTIWAAYKAIFGKEGKSKSFAYGILAATGGTMLASYIGDNGRLMGLGGLFKGLAIGGRDGCTIDKITGLIGRDTNLSNSLQKVAPSGVETSIIPALSVLNIIPDGMTGAELQQYCNIHSDGTVSLKTDKYGNAHLAGYWKNYGDTHKAHMANSIAKQPVVFEQGVARAQLKDDIIKGSPNPLNKLAMSAPLKKLNTYLSKHNLAINNSDAVDRYIAGEQTREKLLAQEDVFITKAAATILTSVPRYDPDHIATLLNAPHQAPTLMGLTLADVMQHANTDERGYAINRVAVGQSLPDPAKNTLLNSTTHQKQERSALVHQLIELSGDDLATLQSSSQTLGQLLDIHRIGLQNLAYAYQSLNNQNLMISVADFSTLHAKIMQSPDTNTVDKLIRTHLDSGSITFDLDSNPMLHNIDYNSLQPMIDSWNTSILPLEKKAEIAAWTIRLQQTLGDKLPTDLIVTPSVDGKTVSVTSYYHTTTISTQPNTTGIYSLTDNRGKTYEYAQSLSEALYMANLLNTAPWMMQGQANNETPFQSDNGRIDFKHNNNRWEASKHIWTSGFDKEIITQAIDTTYLSKDAITTYLPSLSIDKNRTQLCQQLNSMDLWERERDINTLKTNLEGTLTKIDSLNANRVHQIGLYDKKGNKITRTNLEAQTYQAMSGTGNLVELRWESPCDSQSEKSSITIDLHDNQLFGNLSPLMGPDLATTIDTADTFLTAEYILRTWGSDLSTLVVDDIPEWIRKDLGLKTVIQEGEKARKYLQPFFAGIGDIIDTAFRGSVYTVDLIGDGVELGVGIIKLIASWFGLGNVPQV